MDERREFFRAPMRLAEGKATNFSGSNASCFRVTVLDLSGGGACIISRKPLLPDTPIHLRMPADDTGAMLDMPAKVVRIEGMPRAFKIGIQFTGLSDAERDRIVQRVNREEVRVHAGHWQSRGSLRRVA